MMVTFLARYWRVLAIAAAVGLLLYWFTGKLDDAEQAGYDRAQQEAKQVIAEMDAATAAREAEQREIDRAHDIAYQERTRDLQSRIDDLTARNVDLGRLSVRANRSCPAPAGAAAAAAEPDGAAGAGGHDLQAESGLGRDLVRYAGECERYRRQVSALQAWALSINLTQPYE